MTTHSPEKLFNVSLSESFLYEIIDGFSNLAESWENTAEFIESGYNPSDLLIQYCDDSEKAAAIAQRYRELVDDVQSQVARAKLHRMAADSDQG